MKNTIQSSEAAAGTRAGLATPSRPRPSRAAGFPSRGAWSVLALLVLPWTACGPRTESVVVFTAQDRVFAEPVFAAFTEETGIRVLPVHDNEATKTTGLANRLRAEAARPQGDLWWSNEEMRTRQLAREGVLEPGWTSFGERRRVLVVHEEHRDRVPMNPGLSLFTNAEFRGRIAIAYPVFGTTVAHFLVLRQRWGREAWEAWCRALADNRPLILDSNSAVVRLVAQGEVWIGLTDSDDVAFGRREGLSVTDVSLPPEEDLAIPNTLALVRGAPHPDPARRLMSFIAGSSAIERLVSTGALTGSTTPSEDPARPDDATWDRVLDDLDPAIRWLEGVFVR